MNDVVTILGACLVDKQFRVKITKDPVAAALSFCFQLTSQEAFKLQKLAKLLSTNKDVEGAFETIYQAIVALEEPETVKGEGDCCEVPPCEGFVVHGKRCGTEQIAVAPGTET